MDAVCDGANKELAHPLPAVADNPRIVSECEHNLLLADSRILLDKYSLKLSAKRNGKLVISDNHGSPGDYVIVVIAYFAHRKRSIEEFAAELSGTITKLVRWKFATISLRNAHHLRSCPRRDKREQKDPLHGKDTSEAKYPNRHFRFEQSREQTGDQPRKQKHAGTTDAEPNAAGKEASTLEVLTQETS